MVNEKQKSKEYEKYEIIYKLYIVGCLLISWQQLFNYRFTHIKKTKFNTIRYKLIQDLNIHWDSTAIELAFNLVHFRNAEDLFGARRF